MGPAGSAIWHTMLDGAEDILREHGHAALTSRAVAERIGVKQRLIYYYFRTMDDLIVELFQRMTRRELARLESAAQSDKALREIWDLCIHTTDARLISQFMALANRIDALRDEVIDFIERSRSIQARTIEAAAARTGATLPLAAHGLALIATSVALALTREEQLGIDLGHEATRSAIEGLLVELERDG